MIGCGEFLVLKFKFFECMKPFFTELFDYSHHVNQKLADVFISSPDKTSEKAVKLFSHVLSAHQIWNNRIEPAQTPFGVWQLHAVEDFKRIDRSNYEQTLQLLDNADGNKTVRYSNSKGQTFTNSVRDILFHIINHSTYHRGQIATEFRAGGLEPLVIDYVFYKRE